jgi:hypothetical protein
MFRGGTSWLLSRNTAVAALGFLLSLIGALGSAFYLEPAQSTEDAAAQEIVLKSTQARMLRAATAYDDIAGHLGGLLFSVSLPRDAAEHANLNIDTYRAANAFEADLATRMVKAQGDAAMKAITLESDRREAKRVASERGFKLLAITMLGSVLVFVATISGTGAKPAAPRAIGAARLLTIAGMRLKGWNAA